MKMAPRRKGVMGELQKGLPEERRRGTTEVREV